jgi:hypothetical protein
MDTATEVSESVETITSEALIAADFYGDDFTVIKLREVRETTLTTDSYSGPVSYGVDETRAQEFTYTWEHPTLGALPAGSVVVPSTVNRTVSVASGTAETVTYSYGVFLGITAHFLGDISKAAFAPGLTQLDVTTISGSYTYNGTTYTPPSSTTTATKGGVNHSVFFGNTPHGTVASGVSSVVSGVGGHRTATCIARDLWNAYYLNPMAGPWGASGSSSGSSSSSSSSEMGGIDFFSPVVLRDEALSISSAAASPDGTRLYAAAYHSGALLEVMARKGADAPTPVRLETPPVYTPGIAPTLAAPVFLTKVPRP